jgi:hypothetical protein
MVFICISFAALKLWQTTRERGIVSALTCSASLGLGNVLVIFPYLKWNISEFGHMVPISGAIKSSLPHLLFKISNLGIVGEVGALGAIAMTILALSGRVPTTFRGNTLAMASGILAHALYVVTMTNHDTQWSWYYVAGIVNLGLLLSILTTIAQERLPILAGRFQMVTALLIILVAIPLASRAWLRVLTRYSICMYPKPGLIASTSVPLAFRTEGEAMGRFLPDGSRVLIAGRPGAIAYYSNISAFAADGLTNNFQSDADIANYGLNYLRMENICYGLFSEDTVRAGSFELYAPYSHTRVGALDLRKARVIHNFMDGESNLPEVLVKFGC